MSLDRRNTLKVYNDRTDFKINSSKKLNSSIMIDERKDKIK